ncbi:hypothetical protein PhCBS80983_g04077 [Powellomyces hirtus]|uniref:K Homology domain-containing protein n=1 Tax=Powellomyces hirtus TaxID=109895 RepID=A0A507DZA5_9FUNG|nr:hypothetical protein PhCBS80983_g04077 [Powellomyces hirtus]
MTTDATKTTQRKRKWDIAEDGQPDAQRKEPKVTPSVSADSAVGTPNSTDSTEDAAKLALERATLAASRLNAQLGGNLASSADGGLPIRAGPGPLEEFWHDIPINDIKNRYLLTKGATQTMIKQDTGADVTTRGKYYPDKNLATEKEPPLYLHVSAATQKALDAAIAAIEELINSVPPPFEDRRHSGPDRGPPISRPLFSEKVYIGIEADRMFNVRAKIVGPQGQYVKHIQQETQTKVQLKGRGSGYIEQVTGQEADEGLHIHVTGFNQEGVDDAKKLCEDLIETVKKEYTDFKRYQEQRRPPPRPPMNSGYGGYPAQGYGAPGAYGGGYPGQYQQNAPQQQHQHQQQQWAADPYAAYGGYEAYMQYYAAYYQYPAAQQAVPTGSTEQPPPPPPAGQQPAAPEGTPPPPAPPPEPEHQPPPPPPPI